ncbi:hypothetical protein N7447_006154 [Penicillium robsamsonii]|uniref:uncharacterized protein n=1 Tax=Penicillium robsamsonii TaxID=1792511 RepID=UPI002546EC75|nr:uncharacterized protein N7447_006154 [Penicillium robsamsonii]KAJ5823814.1 hypothetical protein N7447_006154 [Penicillium robsamsonii]
MPQSPWSVRERAPLGDISALRMTAKAKIGEVVIQTNCVDVQRAIVVRFSGLARVKAEPAWEEEKRISEHATGLEEEGPLYT